MTGLGLPLLPGDYADAGRRRSFLQGQCRFLTGQDCKFTPDLSLTIKAEVGENHRIGGRNMEWGTILLVGLGLVIGYVAGLDVGERKGREAERHEIMENVRRGA